MTEKQHIRIVGRTIQRWYPNIDPTDAERMAGAIVNNVQDFIAAELEEKESGVVVDMDRLREEPAFPSKQRQPSPLEPLRNDPPPPPQSSSSIILADSKEAKETLADPGRFRAKQPLRLPTSRGGSAPRAGKKFWEQSQLRDYVEENTPDILTVAVPDRPQPIHLIRNIEVQLGTDTIKLSYGVSDTVGPQASLPNDPSTGASLQPMTVDIPIATVISCDEQFPALEDRLRELADKARINMKPRPEHLASATPRRTGPLTYRTEDPHEEVGPTKNPINGKVW